jgi:hypothetical protein
MLQMENGNELQAASVEVHEEIVKLLLEDTQPEG